MLLTWVPAGAQVHTITDLNDAELLDAGWKQIHVGAFGGHDGVDFASGHDAIRDVQARINALVHSVKESLNHGFIK